MDLVPNYFHGIATLLISKLNDKFFGGFSFVFKDVCSSDVEVR